MRLLDGATETVKELLTACPQDQIFDLLEITDDQDMTPLHAAAIWGKTETVKALLAACKNDKERLIKLLTMENNKGVTPSGLVFSSGNDKLKSLLDVQSYTNGFASWALPAIGVMGIAIVGYLGYRYFTKKAQSPKIKIITQSQTSQTLRTKGTPAQITL